jgi:hypothetical protein
VSAINILDSTKLSAFPSQSIMAFLQQGDQVYVILNSNVEMGSLIIYQDGFFNYCTFSAALID